jgi:hypothetical protein
MLIQDPCARALDSIARGRMIVGLRADDDAEFLSAIGLGRDALEKQIQLLVGHTVSLVWRLW